MHNFRFIRNGREHRRAFVRLYALYILHVHAVAAGRAAIVMDGHDYDFASARRKNVTFIRAEIIARSSSRIVGARSRSAATEIEIVVYNAPLMRDESHFALLFYFRSNGGLSIDNMRVAFART